MEIWHRHSKIAFEFSGGKDSTAALYLLKPYWDRFTVYWLNAGDCFPETLEIVERVRADKRITFVEVKSDVHAVIAEHGLPTDLMPCSSSPMGRMIEGDHNVLLQDRYSCCWRTVMKPIHDRVLADGNTCIIRGQKAADIGVPVKGGVHDGIEIFNPIIDWKDADVFAYLKWNDLPISPVYETMNTTPECMSCSAWWDDNRAQYLKSRYPEQYAKYQSRLARIRVVVEPLIAAFNREVM